MSIKISDASTWVQAASTVVLVLITWHYVSITNKLLGVQVDPVIEIRVDLPTQTLTIENYGFNDVSKVQVDVATFSRLNSSGHFFSFNRLKAGEAAKRSIKKETTMLAHNLHFFEAMPGGIARRDNTPPLIVFRATYFREPDHRFYSTKTQVVLLPIKTGYQLVDPNFVPPKGVISYEEFPQIPVDSPVVSFDISGNPVTPTPPKPTPASSPTH